MMRPSLCRFASLLLLSLTIGTLPELRKKWHEQYVQPRFAQLFACVPTY